MFIFGFQIMAKLHFYYSAMNAGKSTLLLQASYNYHERGMRTIIFAPEIDTRSKVGYVSSRIGLQGDAVLFDDKANLYDAVLNQNSQAELSCVLVDEAQFLTKEQVIQFTRITVDFNIPVLAYGLRTDFMGEPFAGSQYLLALADQLVELKTICFCGKKATMNIRVDDKGKVMRHGKQIQIGGNDRYLAVCRKHFINTDFVSKKVWPQHPEHKKEATNDLF